MNIGYDMQDVLIECENKYANAFKYNVVKRLTPKVEHYLMMTSLPFVFGRFDFDLREVWPIECIMCKTVLKRRFMPTGNLRPIVIVVGDAPSAFGGCFDKLTANGGFGRAWVDKVTSITLRMAMKELGLHYYAWYTNLLKCSVPNNRPSTDREILNCSFHMEKELKLLNPKFAILLGSHVAKNWNHDIKSVVVYHPSYVVRTGMKLKDYVKHIRKKIEGVIDYESLIRDAAVNI